MYEIFRHGIFGDIDTACLEKIAKLIIEGKLREAWENDRQETVACILTALFTLALAATGWLHKSVDDETPVFRSHHTQSNLSPAVVNMGIALGVPKATSGPISDAFAKLVFDAFVGYLRNAMPEFMEMIRDLIDAIPHAPSA